MAPLQILLVEDSKADIVLTRRTLSRSKLSIDLHVVRDGSQALEFLHRRSSFADAPRPDLILLDLNTPVMDGWEFLRHRQQDPSVASIPVSVLTTSDAEEDMADAYKMGCNAFVTKPVRVGALLSVLENLGMAASVTAK